MTKTSSKTFNLKKKINNICFVFLISSAILLNGCATLLGKSKYEVILTSSQPGTTVQVMKHNGINVFTGTTPASVVLKAGAGFWSGEDYKAIFKFRSGQTQQVSIERSTDLWYIFGNVVFGGLIGWLFVDPATGAMWKLETNIHAVAPPASSITPRRPWATPQQAPSPSRRYDDRDRERYDDRRRYDDRLDDRNRYDDRERNRYDGRPDDRDRYNDQRGDRDRGDYDDRPDDRDRYDDRQDNRDRYDDRGRDRDRDRYDDRPDDRDRRY